MIPGVAPRLRRLLQPARWGLWTYVGTAALLAAAGATALAMLVPVASLPRLDPPALRPPDLPA